MEPPHVLGFLWIVCVSVLMIVRRGCATHALVAIPVAWPGKQRVRSGDIPAHSRHEKQDGLRWLMDVFSRSAQKDTDSVERRKGALVSVTVLYMSMSLDGFIAGERAA